MRPVSLALFALFVQACAHESAPPTQPQPVAWTPATPARPVPMAPAPSRDENFPTRVETVDAPPSADELPDYARRFVEAHAAVRASVDPPASPPLAPLAWDPQLAAVAQAWAATCPSGHSEDDRYGENMFWSSSTSDPAQSAVRAWSSEAANYDYRTTRCARGREAGWFHCGHYTQMVWRDTTRVGCGFRTDCPGSFPIVVVCEYDPPGNMNVGDTTIPRPY